MSDEMMQKLWEEVKKEKAFDLNTLKVTRDNPVLNHGGGKWLACAREFIICKAVNGEDVVWGSHETLRFRGSLTVYDMEHLAADIAAEAVNEFIKQLRMKGVK